MKIRSHLISGAGNTFHVSYFENSPAGAPPLTIEKMKTLTIRACAENPADGFIFLNKTSALQSNNEYKWWFYNNDGSDAEMCGNATRCVGYYLKCILNNKLDCWSLKTVAGDIKIEFINNENYKITMTPARELHSDLGFFCDTGVPHLVIEKKKIVTNADLKIEARKLRQDKSFFPKGTNVTYIMFEKDDSKIKAVSYERGVEDFTLACGTGAVAAAFFNLTKRAVKQTQVEMPGGTLMIDLSDLDRPLMTGPAALLGSFEYEISV